jgi:hypothetical protein
VEEPSTASKGQGQKRIACKNRPVFKKEAPAYLPGPAYAVQAMMIGGALEAIIL